MANRQYRNVFFLFSVGTKDGTVGPNFGRPEGEGDERLVHILNEASHMMKTPGQVNNDDSRSNDDSCSPRTQCPSPFSNKVTRLDIINIFSYR